MLNGLIFLRSKCMLKRCRQNEIARAFVKWILCVASSNQWTSSIIDLIKCIVLWPWYVIDKYAKLHRYRWIIKYAKSETIQILNKHIWRYDTGATSKLTYSRRENYRLIFLREISSNNYRSISNFGRTVDAISFLAHYYFRPDDLSLPDFLRTEEILMEMS